MTAQRLAAEPIQQKIARSSFGTPSARRWWRRTPYTLAVAQEILARVDDHDRLLDGSIEDPAEQDSWTFIQRFVRWIKHELVVLLESDAGRPAAGLSCVPHEKMGWLVEVSDDERLSVVSSPGFLVEQLALRLFANDCDAVVAPSGSYSRSVSVRLLQSQEEDIVPRLMPVESGSSSDLLGCAADHAEQAGSFDFPALYTRHAKRMRAVSYALVRDPHAADDVVQEVFLHALRRRPWERLDEDALGRWLVHWTRWAAAEQLREAHRRRAVALEEVDEVAASIPDPSPGPEDVAVEDDWHVVLTDALDGLSEQDRKLISLSMQGLDGKELAEALMVPPAAVYVRLHRARQRLLASLGALLVARHGADECADLGAALDGWDGRLLPVVRKRIARHIEGCIRCSDLQDRLTSPAQLLP